MQGNKSRLRMVFELSEPRNDAFADSRSREDPWINRGILGIGGASFLSDSGHELATSLLPTFLSSTLHSGPAVLGAIEGVSDALMGVSKLAGGPLSTDSARRSRLASGGYIGTAIATAAIGLTAAVWQVAILRAVSWMSRGLRSPARDSLLISLTPKGAYGRASGVERAGDNAGAIVGPLLAAGLVGLVGVRYAIGMAIIPGLLAAVAITIAARQAKRTLSAPVARQRLSFNLRELWRAGLPAALTPATLFELGNLATTLLILRATGLLHFDGRSLTAATTLAILLYAVHNAAATVASLVGGHLIDRINPRVVFAAGGAVYVAGYGLFAIDQHVWWIICLAFILSGIGIGFGETAESTTVALMLPDRLRGNGFGVLGLVQSFGDLGATLVAGVLWAAFSPTVAFLYAAAWMLASVTSSWLVSARPNSSLIDRPTEK